MLYENGYDIKILNTINFKKSMKYNPFAYLRSEKDILKLEGMLKNEKFIANAPAEVVQTNREGLENAKDQLSKVENEIRSLKS